jgi:hypothetical protein
MKFEINKCIRVQIISTHILVYILISSFLLISNCKTSENESVIRIGRKRVRVEVADTPSERAIGLSYRKTIEENKGVLFVFPDVSRREFWMYKCNFDIDLAYIDASGVIKEIVTMEREPLDKKVDSLKRYISNSQNIKFTLEMKGGWFKENNIEIGTKINLSHFHTVY